MFSLLNLALFHMCTQNKIDKIQSRQEAKVEKRIREQIQMEQLVYTQDRTYSDALKGSGSAEALSPSGNTSEESNQEAFFDSSAVIPQYDSTANYPAMLQTYYEVYNLHCL